MAIRFEDINGKTLGVVDLVEGRLVGDTELIQRFADEQIKSDVSPQAFMQKFANYNSSYLFSRAE